MSQFSQNHFNLESFSILKCAYFYLSFRRCILKSNKCSPHHPSSRRLHTHPCIKVCKIQPRCCNFSTKVLFCLGPSGVREVEMPTLFLVLQQCFSNYRVEDSCSKILSLHCMHFRNPFVWFSLSLPSEFIFSQ